MPDNPAFANCDADHVFKELGEKVATSETRSLWSRMQQELRRQGVVASVTYLETEFAHIRDEFQRDLKRATKEG